MAKRGKLKKSRKGRDIIKRPIRLKRYAYLFLIVCEDERTEPTYFEQFKTQIPEKTLYLKAVGTGRDPKGVVEGTILEKKKLEEEAQKEVDVVWVVFDKDDADLDEGKKQRFELAFEISERQKFKIAYSNEVFELWLLLHLTDVSSVRPIPRKEIYDRLEKVIRKQEGHHDFVYEHGKPTILEKIRALGKQENAIKRAKKLTIDFKDIAPIQANPSTFVYLLVQELNEWIAYFSYDKKKG